MPACGFQTVVTAADVDEANRLIREAAKSSATDPTTGLIDLDLLATGRSLQPAADCRRHERTSCCQ